jgi:hypothetical protein
VEVELQLHGFLISALDGSEWSDSRPGRFIPRENVPDTHWIGGWVVPRADLDAVVKREIPSPCRDSNSPIIQPVAERYITELSGLLKILRYFFQKVDHSPPSSAEVKE